MVRQDGALTYDDALTQIKGRGNFTWGLAKKPYQIKLKTKTDLLDTGSKSNSAKTWVLLACYGDPALVRDAISFGMARNLGIAETPESCFVDLWYDAEYRGTYLLSEKAQISKGRVNVNEIENSSSSGTDLDGLPTSRARNSYGYTYQYVSGAQGSARAGGYLIEQDSKDNGKERSWFDTSKGIFVVKSPENASAAQMKFISEKFQSLINAGSNSSLFGAGSMDLDSAVALWLVQTLAKNYDYCKSSTFYYYNNNDDTVYSGPLWDLNAAYGDHPDATARDVTGMEYSSDVWFYNNPVFRKRVREMFNSAFKPMVNKVVLGGGDASQGSASIYGLVNLLGASQRMNEVIWGVTANGSYGLSGNTWNSNVDALRLWIRRRLNYMDGIFNSDSWYKDVRVSPESDETATKTVDDDAFDDDALVEPVDEGPLAVEVPLEENEEPSNDDEGATSDASDDTGTDSGMEDTLNESLESSDTKTPE